MRNGLKINNRATRKLFLPEITSPPTVSFWWDANKKKEGDGRWERRGEKRASRRRVDEGVFGTEHCGGEGRGREERSGVEWRGEWGYSQRSESVMQDGGREPIFFSCIFCQATAAFSSLRVSRTRVVTLLACGHRKSHLHACSSATSKSCSDVSRPLQLL